MRQYILFFTLSYLLISCGSTGSSDQKSSSGQQQNSSSESNPRVGPVSEVVLGEFNPDMAAAGKALFDVKCTACHKIDSKYIGPALKGVINRRNPVWIMNMILAPDKMIASDPIAKQLLGESNGAPMANQSLTEEQARQILEYFRQIQ